MRIRILFEGVIDRHRSYHGWPTVAHIGGGRLLAAASGNRHSHVCPFGRVFLYRSADGGRTWEGPEALSSGPLDDRDAGISVAGDGSLLVNYFTNILALVSGRYPEAARGITLDDLTREHGFWMRRSVDGGASWSAKYAIPVNNPHGAALCGDGSLIFAGRLRSESCAYLNEGSRLGDDLALFRSRDNGMNWEEVSRLPVPPGETPRRCFEASQIEAEDGRVIVQVRDQNGPGVRTFQIESADAGHSWSAPRFITTGYPTHLTGLSDGRLLLSCGHRHLPSGVRVMFSSDGGRSWTDEAILYDGGRSADLGYPSTAELPDGTFFTLWYENVAGTGVLKYRAWRIFQ